MTPVYHILYDAGCNLCIATRRLLLTFDSSAPLNFVPIHDPQTLRRFPQVDPARALQQMHVIDPTGRVIGGYEAVVSLLSLVPALRPLHALLCLPRIARHGRRAYGWLARNRYRLSSPSERNS